jgi:hypothetical protein
MLLLLLATWRHFDHILPRAGILTMLLLLLAISRHFDPKACIKERETCPQSQVLKDTQHRHGHGRHTRFLFGFLHGFTCETRHASVGTKLA